MFTAWNGFRNITSGSGGQEAGGLVQVAVMCLCIRILGAHVLISQPAWIISAASTVHLQVETETPRLNF